MDFQKELISEYDREAASTRKILEAIPEDFDPEYRPHPKSMKFGRLAGHVAETTGEWAIHTLTTDGLILNLGTSLSRTSRCQRLLFWSALIRKSQK